jgi:HPt (histidine-containing phosphotransfer) domain-containing protein
MSQPKIFDAQEALERVDNDLKLFSELVNIFFGEYPPSFARLKEAVESRNPRQIEEAAHSLKSALGNIGAMNAFHTAYLLEQAGRDGNLDRTAELVNMLNTNVEIFRIEIKKFLAKDSPAT